MPDDDDIAQIEDFWTSSAPLDTDDATAQW
jgi:hypothetical protein